MTFIVIKSFNNIPIGYLISYESDTTFKVFSKVVLFNDFIFTVYHDYY
jgi:hypothetical protein